MPAPPATPTPVTNSATAEDEQLSAVFAALASGTRRAMLARLARSAATVNELAEPFDLALPSISKHLKVLENAGLVTRGRRAQYRPCAIDAGPLRNVASWVEQYRPVWESRLDQLEDYLSHLTAPVSPPPSSNESSAT